MAITVMIQRTFNDNQTAASLAPLIVKLRSQATIQPGYITGKTFRCLDCPGEFLVISTWHSLDDWNHWFHSDERRNIQKRIDEILNETTRYRIYEPLVGGIIPKFQQELA
jgi:heme-degrading monooxygenase HmoA